MGNIYILNIQMIYEYFYLSSTMKVKLEKRAKTARIITEINK
jgi:hypothetical protein